MTWAKNKAFTRSTCLPLLCHFNLSSIDRIQNQTMTCMKLYDFERVNLFALNISLFV